MRFSFTTAASCLNLVIRKKHLICHCSRYRSLISDKRTRNPWPAFYFPESPYYRFLSVQRGSYCNDSYGIHLTAPFYSGKGLPGTTKRKAISRNKIKRPRGSERRRRKVQGLSGGDVAWSLISAARSRTRAYFSFHFADQKLVRVRGRALIHLREKTRKRNSRRSRANKRGRILTPRPRS